MKRALLKRPQLLAAALVTLACVTPTIFAGDREHGDDEDRGRGNDNASYDPAFNVCRGTDPRCYHDWAHEERDRQPGAHLHAHRRTAARESRTAPSRSASIRRSAPATSCRTR